MRAHTLPVPNPDPVYAPPQSYASAPINPADYSNSTGMVDHPNGVGVPVQYTNRNFQANLGLDGRSGAKTVPGYSGNDSTHYYLPGDHDDLPDVLSPPRSPPATNEQTSEVSYSLDHQANPPAIRPEVDHASLQAIFRLSEADLNLAKSILVMSEANITGAIVYGLVAQRRVTHENLPGNPTQPDEDEVVAPADPPVPNEQVDVRNFLYSDYIKDEIRDFIRRKMIESRMVAYSRHLDDDGVAEPRALLTMTQAHVASLPAHIRRQHLPPGFGAGNNHARRKRTPVVTQLLKNIIDTSHARVRAGGVPSLQMLYTSIHTNFLENSGVHAPRVNWAMLPMRIKVRFAYLRLETAAHTFRNSQRHGSQWTPIDEQLALLTTKSMDYVRAWANAIIALDSQIFGTGGVVFADVRHLVELPTDEAIQDTLVTNELLPPAERPQQPVMEDDLFNMDA
ncbi:uncharacterized protein PGTG_09295 [Puccinia graminis f. sp. tritici CRL 75-36-700-3]|uniref:Uncharacterized protein n=1 Tax=Puccinia graminis f. sp. tritici (strain CRL 75-36-700-3 / race SCCL) TaxID=418459 RepID=E3KH07_PUCGT|nr:uncharacterized protein PGTG_09295 [Puccinia graminis f. sp. tritici CRL 75-36-700-3]EFP83582.2 hypothetical protein PGTG_09295 [Puccinia graminis f. sp. tritici CRL 75-36-700-3]